MHISQAEKGITRFAYTIRLCPKITSMLWVSMVHTLMAVTNDLDIPTSYQKGKYQPECPGIAIYPLPLKKGQDGESFSEKEKTKPPPTTFSSPPYCLGFLASANYQYLQLSQQGLGLVLVNTPTPEFTGENFNALMFKPGWRSAYDVSVGLVTPTAWNIQFDYFLLYNKNNKFQDVPNTRFIEFGWQWNNFFNRFTLLFAKDYTPGRVEGANSEGRGGTFRSYYDYPSTIAFIAFTYAFETQWFNIELTRFNNPLTITRTQETIQKWYGFGPYSGMEMVLPLPYMNYLSFIMLSGLAILPSQTKTHKNLHETREQGGVIVSKVNIHAKNSFPKISTMFDFLLGVRLSLPHFFLQVAWRGEIWPNHLELFNYNTGLDCVAPILTQSNYSTSGLSITGGALF